MRSKNVACGRCKTILFATTCLWIAGSASSNRQFQPQFLLLARTSVPAIESLPLNVPHIDTTNGRSDERFELLQSYYKYVFEKLVSTSSEEEQAKAQKEALKKLAKFVNVHMSELKRLLIGTDRALASMLELKLSKKMDASENKIKQSQAMVPFGLYVSPEFKCLDTSYYIVSAHNQEDVQNILTSERKPNCYTTRASFAWGGFFHRRSETTYVGPHNEIFKANNYVQGLYCATDEIWLDTQCIYKIPPREVFPESVEYEPKVSYQCGPFRYFLPTTTDIRCVFQMFSMSFVLRFGYEGIRYKHSEMSFSYHNGQSFYTDEPWAGMSCWGGACKWRHNQNQRMNEFFVQ